MDALSGIFYETIIDTLLGDPDNHDIYEKKLTHPDGPKYDLIPCHLYFYYFAFDPNGRPIMRQYDYEDPAGISYNRVPALMDTLSENARFNEANPAPILADFSKLKWDRISYICIVMDSPYWRLWKRISDPNKSGIVFNTGKGSTKNHSFFDATDLDVSIPDRHGSFNIRSALYVVNHIRDEHGNILGTSGSTTKSEFFKFDMCFDMSDGGSLPMGVMIDPGGTNMGPPPPPPPY